MATAVETPGTVQEAGIDGARARPVGHPTVLVSLDGSQFARAALAPAIQMAHGLHAPLVLVQAVQPANVPDVDRAVAYQLGETDAYESVYSAAREARARGLEAVEVLVKGSLAESPARAILAAAQEFDAKMIVMATHGLTGIKRAVLGSVADEVVSRSPVPVLLVRPPAERVEGATAEAPPGAHTGRIMVALDGTPDSESSFRAVAELAGALGAEVELARVIYGERQPDGGCDTQAASIEARAYLEGAAQRLAACGIAPGAIHLAVPPAAAATVPEALVRHAAQERAALLVLASHVRRGVARLMRGSVGSGVVARTAVPVLVVRAAK